MALNTQRRQRAAAAGYSASQERTIDVGRIAVRHVRVVVHVERDPADVVRRGVVPIKRRTSQHPCGDTTIRSVSFGDVVLAVEPVMYTLS